ncbi:hypothetical protein [Bacillus massiliigorillae]|uniref:hypothetical protein n=1 Tax=Bacillus massiliigorillae TaxID=1243664 RepID=UPI0012B565D6|nr:hypothetical protein [Bacillus massiliigorillae]
MSYLPLAIAIMVGIAYGAIRTVKQSKQDDNKRRSNPYTESIVVTLVVYLICSVVITNL